MLIGRDRELEQIEALLDEARRGRSSTLAIVGEPGVGKTALLEEAKATATDMRVLAATGFETESDLPFAALHELLRPLLDLLPRIPAAQARTLTAALALAKGTPDKLATGAGTLSLLVEAAEETTVLLLLDDVHWLDEASAGALVFAARRLRMEQIAVLAAFRPGAAPLFEKLPRLELRPLVPDDARRLLRSRQTPVAAADEAGVLAAAAGNPLALLELPAELARDLPAASSSHDRLQRTFAQQIDALPRSARLGLMLAAAEPDPATVRRATELQQLDDPLGAAERAGLVRIGAAGLAFRHPVVRSLVYAAASSAERAAAHRALADVLSEEADGDRRAWHLAAAAEAPDEEIAALLEATAERAIARGGHAAAARARERAARLSVDPDSASSRLAAAARAAASAGEIDRAVALAEEAVACARDPLVRSRAILQQTMALGWANPAAYDPDRFLAAIGNLEQLDPDYAARALQEIVNRRCEALDLAGAKELLPKLERLSRRAGQHIKDIGLSCAADVYLATGDREGFARLFAEFCDNTRAVAGSAIDLIWAGEYETVGHALDAESRKAQSSGYHLFVLWIDACRSHLELRLGRLQAAKLAASRAVTLADASGFVRFGCVASCALANVHAWQGDAEACRRTAAEALAVAEDARLVPFEFSARTALGLLALGSGQPAEVIEELTPQAERWQATDLAEPSMVPFVPDLVEAHAANGTTDQASYWLDRFSEITARVDRAWALAACARCEGLLAAAGSFDEPFLRALELHEREPLTLEHARTQLAYGERLRRHARKQEARVQLRQAHATFVAVSATPWQARALAELRATGERIADDPRPLPELTPQELQISMLVADGKTNKQIAAAMYLSPKTIEHHLANTYRKLDIHTRAELARLVAQGETPSLH